MDQKPQAGSTKKNAAKAKNETKSQRERFIETAREIGVDESGGEFERELKKVIPLNRKNGL